MTSKQQQAEAEAEAEAEAIDDIIMRALVEDSDIAEADIHELFLFYV
jgi:hypothetical protein